MFNFLKKQSPKGTTATFKINGMHCTSCSLNIDGELEDTAGVLSANTSYAKAQTTVQYDPEKIQPKKLKKIIEALEYTATELK